MRAQRDAAVSAFEARAGGRLDRAAWQIENGYFEAAEDALDQLGKDLKGTEELAQRCEELVRTLKSDELDDERDRRAGFDPLGAA